MIKNFLNNHIIQSLVERVALSISETDDTFRIGTQYGGNSRDRYAYDRKQILEKALKAWRINPLARRLVELMTQFVIGDGVNYEASPRAKYVLDRFWNDPLNRVGEQLAGWSDEIGRTGDLFLLFSHSGGRLYVRAVASELIQQIDHAPNDVAQERKFIYGTGDADYYPAYLPDVEQDVFMRHYAVNRAVGAQFGESDLAPVLTWLSQYTDWLENRARLNFFRTAFLYIVQRAFKSDKERQARQAELMANPPKPGSILLVPPEEEWSTVSSNLDAKDASADGLAIKKMIAAGYGIPLHWLAEPESATRTTAEAAGTPTFRRLAARQAVFVAIVRDVLTIVLARAGLSATSLVLRGDDITERDNSIVSLALARAIPSVGELFDRKLIDSQEFVRLVYRLANEEIPSTIGDGVRRPIQAQTQDAPSASIVEDNALESKESE